jgi:hypothetical protein
MILAFLAQHGSSSVGFFTMLNQIGLDRVYEVWIFFLDSNTIGPSYLNELFFKINRGKPVSNLTLSGKRSWLSMDGHGWDFRSEKVRLFSSIPAKYSDIYSQIHMVSIKIISHSVALLQSRNLENPSLPLFIPSAPQTAIRPSLILLAQQYFSLRTN